MLKQLKSVSMLLFLLTMSVEAAYPETGESTLKVSVVQQGTTCKGVVKDAAGETIIGASVVAKGTTNGTITGINGDFSLNNVKTGDIIVVSFVGYQTQEIKFTGQSLNIILKDNTQTLDEVVVVAFGTQKKVNVTGSVSTVGAKEISARPVNSTIEALQGMSSSLPEDVQQSFLRTIKGLENVEIMRPAYAIEYDCCNPVQMKSTLEFKSLKGLYGAGQFNGSSGYEEAAAQGLVAGINAALSVQGRQPMILDRASSYIGTLIDDLVTKGCADPYRMMTSRSEYRLVLRQDNADQRLTPIGYKLGLISEERYQSLLEKVRLTEDEIKRVKKLNIAPSEKLNSFLEENGTSSLTTGCKLADLIRRPQLGYDMLNEFDEQRAELPFEVREQVELQIKYEGYIEKQMEQIEIMRKLEGKALPDDIDYSEIRGLRLEAAEKLNKQKPENIGQASRISGVSPADVSVLAVWLEQKGGRK